MLLAADKQNTTDEQFAEDLLQSDNETENKPKATKKWVVSSVGRAVDF